MPAADQHPDADKIHAAVPALGVLLTNVGSPAAPTPTALREYLAQFLWDPRVIVPPPPRWLWWLILHGIVLRTRPAKSAKLYANIWTAEGSPLIAISKRQRAGIEKILRERVGGPVHVALGMGYGEPALAGALAELKAKHCRRIVVFPLFPQASGPTTASTFDGVAAALKDEPWIPELRFVHGYHDRPRYIELLAASVREAWAKFGKPEKLVMSFHGVPKRYLLNGDPYHCFCQKTGRLLAEKLELGKEDWVLTFQSRFGREEWLKPYTDATLQELARTGLRKIHIISPAFSADCLETLEELAMTNKEIYAEAVHAAGGGAFEYEYIAALNDGAGHLEMLAEIALENMAGWAVKPGEYSADAAREQAEATARRAGKLMR